MNTHTMDTSTVTNVLGFASRLDESQHQPHIINDLYPMASATGHPVPTPSPVLHSGLDAGLHTGYTASPPVNQQHQAQSVPSQGNYYNQVGGSSPFGSQNALTSPTPPSLLSVPAPHQLGVMTFEGVSADASASALYSPGTPLGHAHHHSGGVPSNAQRMSMFSDQALGIHSGPAYPPNISSLDIPFAYSSQPRDSLGSVLFDTQALSGFPSQSMFGDMSAYSSPSSSQQLGIMPPTPISAPFAGHSTSNAAVAAAMASANAMAERNGQLGLSLQAPNALFHHHSHYSAGPLGTINSAPPNMLEFPHDVLRVQGGGSAERQVSSSPYYDSTVPNTPIQTPGMSISKAGAARRGRTHNGTTEHRYRRKSELGATDPALESIKSAIMGSSNGGSSTSAGLNGGARCVSSTLAESSNFRFEHVFPINDKAETPLPLRRQAVSAHARLSTPLGFAATRDGGGPVNVTPFLGAPGFKGKTGARRAPGAAMSLRMSPCDNALGLVGGNNGAGQAAATIDTAALSLQRLEEEEDCSGDTRQMVTQSFSSASGMHSQNCDFGSSVTAGSDSGSISVEMSSSSSSHDTAGDVKPVVPSKKRVRKETGGGPATKRSKAVVKTEDDATVKSEHEGECLEIKCGHPDCERSFTRKYNLKSHERTHTDERPYACSLCEQRFSRNHDLKRHMKIHSGDRPFKCHLCHRGFARADALSRHTLKGSTCKRAGTMSAKARRANAAAGAAATSSFSYGAAGQEIPPSATEGGN